MSVENAQELMTGPEEEACGGRDSCAVPALLDRVRELEAESRQRGAELRDLLQVDLPSRIAERDAALSTIAKVEALHRPFEWSFGFGPVTSCKGCADQGVPQENASWPCPTVAALDGAPEPEPEPDAEPKPRPKHNYRWKYPNGRVSWTFATLDESKTYRPASVRLEGTVLEQSLDNGKTWLPVEGESK